MQIDLTRIGDVEGRRKWLILWQQGHALEEQRPSRGTPGWNYWDESTWSDDLRAAKKHYDELRDAEIAKRAKLMDETDREFEDKIEAIDRQMDELQVPQVPEYDDDGCVRICALTGLPIFETDDVIKDEETGDLILRAVLPFPEPEVEQEDAA